MRLVTYITEKCEKESRKLGLLEEMNRLAKKVETDQSVANWDNFLPSPYIKKSLGTWRLIAEKREIENNLVICFLTMQSRGGNEYDKDFLSDPANFCKSITPSDEAIIKHLDSLEADSIVALAEPSPTEYSYLYGVLDPLDESEGVIYESKEWIAEIGNHGDWLSEYYGLVEKATKPDNADKMELVGEYGHRIIYKYFSDQKFLFLIAPLGTRDQQREAESFLKKYEFLSQRNGNEWIDDQLKKQSGRSYPMLIVADADIWMEIEKNTEGNLALSPEEAEILQNVRHYRSDSPMYPLFINGRPGSGKSTILQYLFAERLYLHLQKDPQNQLPYPPLYLTYSDKLLQVARKSVETILRCNSALLTSNGGVVVTDPRVRNTLQISFAEFHKFLFSLLPDSEKPTFDPDRRIDFNEFRKLWQERRRGTAETRKFSSELVWHIIRTFIKGMSDDPRNFFDPDAYTELPQDQQTVSDETFEKVYSLVWEGWYKGLFENDGFWDTQDLTRKVLDLEMADLSCYPAIFCDEAQDFTKIELQLILKLSLFPSRNLPPQDLKRVPFAFAGDPFQTLNPTGFDWKAVRASFHETIVQDLDKMNRANLKFNYHELSFNYRSSKHIVGFCNLVQMLRGLIFGIKNLKPQRTWFDDQTSSMPAFFDVNHYLCRKNLKEQEEIVIILPCQEGEEGEYVKNDPLLSEISDASNELRNFLSPMSAKGLEFQRVVLYKFGDDLIKNYPEMLSPLDTTEPHQDHRKALPYEYFLNRLYVAASRPKRRLLIVDTQDGIEGMWNNARICHPTNLIL